MPRSPPCSLAQDQEAATPDILANLPRLEADRITSSRHLPRQQPRQSSYKKDGFHHPLTPSLCSSKLPTSLNALVSRAAAWRSSNFSKAPPEPTLGTTPKGLWEPALLSAVRRALDARRSVGCSGCSSFFEKHRCVRHARFFSTHKLCLEPELAAFQHFHLREASNSPVQCGVRSQKARLAQVKM